MRMSKRVAALLLVLSALAAAAAECDLVDVISRPNDPDFPVTATPYPTSLLDDPLKTLNAPFKATFEYMENHRPMPILATFLDSAGSEAQYSNLYVTGYGPTTPFSQLFGNLDQSATLASLKNAIPDLKLSERMVVQQNDWAAIAYDLSGTFTQPLVTATTTLPPTNKSWFTTVHMIVHLTGDGKIDREYSVTDMAAMMHEAGVPGYENVPVGNSDIEKPMTERVPDDDPTASGYVSGLLAKVGGGPFLAWLPSGVPRDMPTTYHSPYGDAVGKLPEVESKLLMLTDAQVILPVIVQQGNSVGVLYRYNGTVGYPVKFSNGTVIQPSDTPVQFIGIALGDVDATGHIQAWNMINRLDNPISPDTFAPVPGITTTQEVAPEATLLSEDYGDEFPGDTTDAATEDMTRLTPAAPDTSLTPAPPSVAASTCTVTAPQKVNLRQGPGTSFAIGGTLVRGQTAEADGQAKGSDGMAWFHLSALNLWARSNVVTGECAALPEITPG